MAPAVLMLSLGLLLSSMCCSFHATSKRSTTTSCMMTDNYDITSPNSAFRKQMMDTLLGVGGFALAFRGGAALAVIDQPQKPMEPSGPFKSIGVRIRRFDGGFRGKIFYPAESSSESRLEAPYCTDGRETSDGMAGLVGFRQAGLSFLLAHLASAGSGSFYECQPDTSQAFPMLVYSHGYGGNMDMASYFLREIASHGVIVVAVEHTEGTASSTILKDGSLLPFSPRLYSSDEQLRIRAKELVIALKLNAVALEGLNIDSDRVFVGGHSYGGPSSIRAASLRAAMEKGKGEKAKSLAKIRGLVLHDPALSMGTLGQDNVVLVPTVSWTSDEYDRAGIRCGHTLHAKGCFHGNFVDAALWAPWWVMRPLSTFIPAAGPCDPIRMHHLLADSASAFMKDPTVSGIADMKGLEVRA